MAAESPAEELRRAARRLRIDARVGGAEAPGEKWRTGLVKFFDGVARDMDGWGFVEERTEGVGVVYPTVFQVAPLWTAALAAARACAPREDSDG